MLRRRVLAAVVVATLLTPVLAPVCAFAQPAPDAKASLADAEKAAHAKDWPVAAKLYDAANKAQPSSDALEGLANAEYQSGQIAESHAAYVEWLAHYGAKAPAAKKKAAEARVAEIAAKTGTLTVSVAEPNAAVTVDDKAVGTSPLAAPLRVVAGTHRVRVTKEGFLPFEQAPNVAAGGSTTVSAVLAPSSTKGKLVVREKSGKPMRVLVDGVDMGETPWTGEVDAGPHAVAARGVGLIAAPQRVNVEPGKTQPIELVASSSSAPIKIATSDGKGLIYLDGKIVGEGSFVGEISAGPHALRITREGYDPVEEEILVKDKEPLARTVTMRINSKIETGSVEVVDRMEGIYGGVSFLAMWMPGGTGSAIQKSCEGAHPAELVGCNAPDGFGGGFGGFVGYHWDPVGIELFVAGQYDARTLTRDWNASSTDLGLGPDPARTEQFKLRRAGGMALARARLTLQGTHVRFTTALGAGVSKRYLFLERDTAAKDASGGRDVYVSSAASYWSPVVMIEPAVMFRLTHGMSLGVGMQLYLEAPATFMSGNPKGENPMTSKESGHVLPGVIPRGLTTDPFDLASNLQVYVGPFVGLMFGP